MSTSVQVTEQKRVLVEGHRWRTRFGIFTQTKKFGHSFCASCDKVENNQADRFCEVIDF